MTDVLIKRELLERLEHVTRNLVPHLQCHTDLVAALAAPRQPEGEGLEVVAWQDAENPLYTTGEKRQMHGWATDGYPVVELCRLSDAQRAIAKLREECKIHRNSAAGAHNQLRANRLETERLAVDWQAAVAERDTLRQQIAEVNEQSETRWGGYVRESNLRRAIEQQRDKLAVLLSFGRDHVVNARHDVEVRSMNGNEASTLVLAGIDQWLADINAALAEVSK